MSLRHQLQSSGLLSGMACCGVTIIGCVKMYADNIMSRYQRKSGETLGVTIRHAVDRLGTSRNGCLQMFVRRAQKFSGGGVEYEDLKF